VLSKSDKRGRMLETAPFEESPGSIGQGAG